MDLATQNYAYTFIYVFYFTYNYYRGWTFVWSTHIVLVPMEKVDITIMMLLQMMWNTMLIILLPKEWFELIDQKLLTK